VFSDWREEQLNTISQQIQQTIKSIQSPPESSCLISEKIYCKVPKLGFAAQIHGLMTCLLKGYYTKTLVVIDQIFINYFGESNSTWDNYISPISETCQPNHTFKYVIKDSKSVIEWNSK
jgi:hypothetical protein